MQAVLSLLTIQSNIVNWIYPLFFFTETFLVAQSTQASSESEESEDELDGDIDEVEPIPEDWKQKFKNFGQEGTKAAYV